jgi:hypothetical protein
VGAARAAWLEWSEELEPLKLSLGGRIAFCGVVLLVLPVALLAALAGVGFAFYNLFSGRDGDTAVAVQLIFVFGVVAVGAVVVIGVCLGAIAGIDAAVRGIRWSLRRCFAHPS